MKPPDDLKPAARRFWTACERELGDKLTPKMRPALERYVQSVSLAREAWATIAGEGLTSLGSSGQPVAHHLLATLLSLEASAAKFGQAIGLEPVAAPRNAGGRPVGAVSADDRAAQIAAPVVDMSKLRRRSTK